MCSIAHVPLLYRIKKRVGTTGFLLPPTLKKNNLCKLVLCCFCVVLRFLRYFKYFIKQQVISFLPYFQCSSELLKNLVYFLIFLWTSCLSLHCYVGHLHFNSLSYPCGISLYWGIALKTLSCIVVVLNAAEISVGGRQYPCAHHHQGFVDDNWTHFQKKKS